MSMTLDPAEAIITVLVSDSTQIGCQLLAAALSRSHYRIKVIGSASDSAGVLDDVSKNEPDVALISASLQDGGWIGFQVLRKIRQSHPKVRVVILLDCSERDLVIDAFRGGASGVFCRSESIEKLCRCVYSVHRGQIWASSQELQFLLEAFAQTVPLRLVNARGADLLTKREEQVVHLVTEGLTNREISRKLSLSEHTIKNYLFRVYDKLGISSRVELTLYAVTHRQPLLAVHLPVVRQAEERK